MITELRTFIAVVRYGTFGRAGSRIGLTQGAVSAQIQRLEQHLGYELFDRNGRKAALTAMGREALAQAERIVAAFDQLGTPHGGRGAQGVLRIGAIASSQSSWLIGAAAEFRRQFPGMTLRIVPGASLSLLGQVDSGDIDMAVMIRPPYVLPPEVRWHPLAREPFVLLAPAAMPGDDWRALLRAGPFVRYDRSSFGGRVVDQFLRAHELDVREALELDEIGGLIEAVAQGMGVAIVPAIQAHLPFPRQVRTVPLDGGQALFREIGVAERVAHSHPAVTERLLELIRQESARSAAYAQRVLARAGAR